jgi:hypothetical protein
MDPIQDREPLPVVAPKASVETLADVDAQELAHRFDSENFGVRELGLRASLADALSIEPIVDEAKGDDDEGVKIHGRPPCVRRCFIGAQRYGCLTPGENHLSPVAASKGFLETEGLLHNFLGG